MPRATRPRNTAPTTAPNNSNLTPVTRQSLEDFYRSGVSLPQLKDQEYPAQIIGHQYVPPKAGSAPGAEGYIRLDIKLPDRQINDNRFSAGFAVFLNEIKEQLGMQDSTVPVQDLLNTILGQPIKLWISHVVVDGKTYRNVNFKAPAAPPKTTDDGPIDGQDY